MNQEFDLGDEVKLVKGVYEGCVVAIEVSADAETRYRVKRTHRHGFAEFLWFDESDLTRADEVQAIADGDANI